MMSCDTEAETRAIRYSASEITPEYCKIAKEKYPEIEFLNRDLLFEEVKESYDYVVLSGVFHQQGQISQRDWEGYRNALLLKAWSLCTRGVAFNLLSNYTDFYRPGNYYPEMYEVLGFVTRKMSRFVSMDQTTPLFEATYCVYKKEYVSSCYESDILKRYLEND